MANILVIGKYYPPYNGGIENYTMQLCEELAKRHVVRVVVYNSKNALDIESERNIDIVRVPRFLVVKGQPISLSMTAHVRIEEFDVIHFHAPNFFANAVLQLKLLFAKRTIPILITHHADVYGRPFLRAFALPFYRYLVRRASAVIVTSPKNGIASSDLPPGTPTTTVPLWIDLDAYDLSAEERERGFLWKRNFVGDAPVVAFVGRHARYKGLEVLVEAVAQIPNLHALIAGEGPYQAKARRAAESAGIADRVHFLGAISTREKIWLLGSCDVFAFPSTEKTEAFGFSLLEAMAVGAPVVASELPTGVTDVAVDGETALLVKPGDAKALSERISELLRNSSLAEKLRSAGRAHVEQHYAKPVVLGRLVGVFDEVLSEARAKVPG